jgi:hypothetical protein
MKTLIIETRLVVVVLPDSSPSRETQIQRMRILEALPSSLLLLLACLAVSAHGDAFSASPRTAFAPRPAGQVSSSLSNIAHLAVRGGATLAMEEETDDEEEFEDEEEEEEMELDASLAASALKSTTKTKASSSKSAAVKKTMSAKLATKKPKKKGSLLKFLHVPYIVRACLNPFTVLSMTKHFWLSLVNLEYPPKVRFLRLCPSASSYMFSDLTLFACRMFRKICGRPLTTRLARAAGHLHKPVVRER